MAGTLATASRVSLGPARALGVALSDGDGESGADMVVVWRIWGWKRACRCLVKG